MRLVPEPVGSLQDLAGRVDADHDAVRGPPRLHLRQVGEVQPVRGERGGGLVPPLVLGLQHRHRADPGDHPPTVLLAAHGHLDPLRVRDVLEGLLAPSGDEVQRVVVPDVPGGAAAWLPVGAGRGVVVGPGVPQPAHAGLLAQLGDECGGERVCHAPEPATGFPKVS